MMASRAASASPPAAVADETAAAGRRQRRRRIPQQAAATVFALLLLQLALVLSRYVGWLSKGPTRGLPRLGSFTDMRLTHAAPYTQHGFRPRPSPLAPATAASLRHGGIP